MSNAFFQWQPEGGSHALQQEYWETGACGCMGADLDRSHRAPTMCTVPIR